MKFLNGWAYTLSDVLLAGGETLPIDPAGLAVLNLAVGEQCVLAVSERFPAPPPALEIIVATGTAGGISLARGAQGTTAADWPAGSVVYAPITADHMVQLQAAITDLTARVVALEAGGAIPDGALADENGNVLANGQGDILTMGA